MAGSGAVILALCGGGLVAMATLVVWALLRGWQRHSDDLERLVKKGRPMPTFSGYVVNNGGVIELGNGTGSWPLHELIAEEWPSSPVADATVTWAYAPQGTPPATWLNDPSATTAAGELAYSPAGVEVDDGSSAIDITADLAAHVGEYAYLRITAV